MVYTLAMRENWSKLILKFVGEGIGITSDLVIGILEAGYGASYKQMERSVEETRERRQHFFGKDYSNDRRKLSNLISKLKKEGLIKKEKESWALTSAGSKRLRQNRANLPKRDYEKQGSKTLKIIVFDIPESLRPKRAWLRASLSDLGFSMLQKSVWYGKYALPESFIVHLDEIELGDFVQIMEITRTGSLVEL